MTAATPSASPASRRASSRSSEMLLHFDDEAPFAGSLAQAAGLEPRQVQRHRFPDGELKLTLPVPLPPSVVVLRSLHHPNEKLVELVLLADAAARGSASGT